MIYELAVVAEAAAGDEKVASLNEMISAVVGEFAGEVLIQDDWGTKKLAQATSEGVEKGRFLYYIYEANTSCNTEISRRLGISEDVIKRIFIKLGAEADKVVKNYKTPFSKKYNGSQTDSIEEKYGEMEKDRKKFARRKSCWFAAKNIKADWKDPATYAWLINEFGKISPARISGTSAKHQRFITTAIKRARQVGIVSHMSNAVAE
ncbi:MAG: 30S ribosomal protein S18 [Bacteriovoracaceae bacterium]|nr:30S ribosomal protein S18 [Bacteriovoracaceae bacterium]